MLKRLLAIFLCFSFLFSVGCAGLFVSKKSAMTARQVTRGRYTRFDIPITVNDKVVSWIDYFQGRGKKHFAVYLQRSGKYELLMRKILRENGVPQDLVFLAMIESGFSSRAYSRARAAGYWQFIQGTGKKYGLGISYWVDERRDPEKATAAAARHLKDLYREFGDWYLALAAYNAGEGKIRKGLRQTGARDFWGMIENDRWRYIKRETRDYVPKFLAATIIAKAPERFGFGNVVYEKPMSFETATVKSQTDLGVIAKCAGVDTNDIAALNGELFRGITPDTSNYTIRLPRGTAQKFNVTYAALPASERITVVQHHIRQGESLGSIARKYHTSVRMLMAANGIRNPSKIRAGRTLVIPLSGAAKMNAEQNLAKNKKVHHAREGDYISHRVRRGEVLGKIAERYGVRVSSIRSWNGIRGNMIRSGQTLKMYTNKPYVAQSEVAGSSGKLTYTIRSGDSWWRIAQRYGVSINQLKEWNPNINGNGLRPGQRLALFSNTKEEKPSERLVASNRTADISDRLDIPEESVGAKVVAGPIIAEHVNYEMKSGDTLWDLAKKYGVTVSDIMEWNDLDGRRAKRLRPGNVIKLKIASTDTL